MICYFIAFLDRVNVGFAATMLNRDLGFSASVYGFGAGIFFISYFLFELPSNLALHKFGARRWIARIMITWGVISGATAFVVGPNSFHTVRFLLGATGRCPSRRPGRCWKAEAAREGVSPYSVLNRHVAALEAREAFPTRHLHVLADHHGNRSPRADAQALGMVAGLTLESGVDALARLYLATVQALAYGTREIVEAIRAAGHRIDRIVACGGGTKNPLWLREHADAIGCDIHMVADEDAVTLARPCPARPPAAPSPT
jgi:hypothetical protein